MSERSRSRELVVMIVLLSGLLVLFCGSCGGGIYLFISRFGADLAATALVGDSGAVMELQKQDYAEARQSFQTRLTKQAPSPQKYDRPQPPPAGVKVIEFPSAKLKLKAWINQPPPGRPPMPAVLFLHSGFAFGKEDWDQCRAFRDAGFVTMLPILRGENGQPGSFTMFYDEVDDVIAAAEALARQPGVDPQHLYLSGHSAGGTLTMLGAMTSNRFRAAASISGAPDQAQFSKEWTDIVPFNRKNPRELQMRSPLAYATSFKCPVRMYFGTQELGYRNATKQTAERAKTAGIDAEAVPISGDHDSCVPSALKQAIDFFNSK